MRWKALDGIGVLLMVLAVACRPPQRPVTRPPLPVPEGWIRVGLLETRDPIRLDCLDGCRWIVPGRAQRTLPPGSHIEIRPLYRTDVSTSDRTPAYWVQVGAFREKRHAEQQADRVRDLLPPAVSVRLQRTETVWQVLVGPWVQRSRAATVRRQLRMRGMDAWIRRISPHPALAALQCRVGDFAMQVPSRQIVEIVAHTGVVWRGHRYPERMQVRPLPDGTVALINIVPLETYLVGVVIREMHPDRYPAIEALKAQAVAARTYAIRHLGQYASRGYDICATPRCQVYTGIPAEADIDLAERAVAATRGEILTYRGKPIEALYTSTCGGHTDRAADIFPRIRAPYLQGVPCTGEPDPPARWLTGLRPPEGLTDPARIPGLVAWLHAFPETAALLRESGAGDHAQWEQLYGTWSHQRIHGRPITWRTVLRHLGARMRDATWDELLLPEESSILAQLAAIAPGTLDGDLRRGLLWLLLFDRDLAGLWMRGPDALDRPIRWVDWLRIVVHWWSRYRPLPDPRTVTVQAVTPSEIRVLDADGVVRTFPLTEHTVVLQEWGRRWVGGTALIAPGDRVVIIVSDDDAHLDAVISQRPTGWIGTADRNSVYAWWVEERTGTWIDARLQETCTEWQGPPVDVAVTRMSRYGRVVGLRWRDSAGHTCDLERLQIRWTLGLRELRFRMIPIRTPDGRIDRILFIGRGWGHGVGLCQTGAFGMAMQGYDYRAILYHYYPGTEIRIWTPGGK